jgi:branched-chain amino acid transport system substrate-binding protein
VAYHIGNEHSVLSAYQQLIDSEVDAVTAGYACYSPSVHDLIGEAGIPYLHAATMDRAVDRVRGSQMRLRNIFQTCASDVNYGIGLARFIGQLQPVSPACAEKKRLAIVQPLWPGPDIDIRHIEAMLSRQGWDIEIISVASSCERCWQQTITGLD